MSQDRAGTTFGSRPGGGRVPVPWNGSSGPTDEDEEDSWGSRASGWRSPPNIPRLDLLVCSESGADAAANLLAELLPGWSLTGRTKPYLVLGSGVKRKIYIGSWGPTIIIGGDYKVLDQLVAGIRKRRAPDDPGVWRLSSSAVINHVELLIEAPGWDCYVLITLEDSYGPYGDRDDEDGSRTILETSGEPLPFEAELWNGVFPDGTYDDADFRISDEDFAERAWQWILGLTSSAETIHPALRGLIDERVPDPANLIMHEAARDSAE